MIIDRNKNARGNPLRINMIDCGLTVELGERNHENIVKILGALIKRDGHLAGQLMVDTAKKCQATELDVELFCMGIQKICEDDEENNFLEKGLYIICGDRHWKYHAKHPSGFEEFSSGALVDNNSRAGRVAGDPESTDPNAEIEQFFIEGTPESASGGFLMVTVEQQNRTPAATLSFYDEQKKLLYEVVKGAE